MKKSLQARADSRRHRQHGFTMVEVLIVLVLVALLATVGVPAFRQQVMDARMASLPRL